MESGERAGAALGAVLLAAVGVLRAIQASEDETTAYAIGVGLGSVVASLLIAIALRWVYVRFRETGEVRSQWVIWIAVLIAMVVAISQGVRESEEREAEANERFVAAAEDCKAAEPDPFSGLPAGYTLSELGGRSRVALEKQLGDAAPFDRLSDLVEGRRIEQRGRTAGVALAFAGLFEDRAGFETGFERGAAAAGRDLERIDVAGQEVMLLSVRGAAIVAGFSGCYGMIMFSRDQDSAVALAEVLLTG